MDNETTKQLSIDENISIMLESDGWQSAKAMLLEDLANIAIDPNKLDSMTNDQIAEKVKLNSEIVKFCYKWLDKIEGSKNVVSSFNSSSNEYSPKNFIKRV